MDKTSIEEGETLVAAAWHVNGCDILIAAHTEAELLFAGKSLGLAVDLERCRRVTMQRAKQRASDEWRETVTPVHESRCAECVNGKEGAK